MPEDTGQDVQEESSPSETVNEPKGDATPTESVAQETNEQPQEEGQETTPTAPEEQKTSQLDANLYDERGVPWKNVAQENRRKYEEFQSSLPQRIAEEVAKLSQPQQKQYTIGELEKFAQENPEHRAWVEEEKAKVLRSEITKEVETRIQAQTKAQQDEMARQHTFNQVMQQFPDMAIRDQQGRFVSWNNMSPMTQAVGRYMSNNDLANRPDGLMVASKLAFADLAFQNAPKTAKTVKSMKSQLRKAQAQTFVEGGGRKPGPTNPMRAQLDRVRQSGSREDGAAVMRSILKAKGTIKE